MPSSTNCALSIIYDDAAAWLTDIHINFLSPVSMEKLLSQVRGCGAECILISGDIGEAPRLTWYLRRLEKAWERPIYFVLGNHDYYRGSFDEVAVAVTRLCQPSPHLKWLTGAGVVELTPSTALVGHDSWADGRCGDYANSDVMLNDYVLIRESTDLDKQTRLQKLNALGDFVAQYVRHWLPKALQHYQKVYFLTHVPPFAEACWHEGQLCDDNFLPHFACKTVGDALLDIMADFPHQQLTVLCGHTHGAARVQVRDNLLVMVGEAEYGVPKIQALLEIE